MKRYLICMLLSAALTFSGCSGQTETTQADINRLSTDNPVTTEPREENTQSETETQQDAESSSENAPETETESENTQQQRDYASELLESMSLEEKIGQVILARYTQETKEKAGECFFGGFTLYAADFENETKESLEAKLAPLYSALTVPPFIAADEEGGQVVRISEFSEFAERPLPPLYTAKDDIKGFAEETAEVLKGAGVNLNLAPVADVAENSRDYIYYRTCRSDYEETGEIIGTLIAEFNRLGIVSCLKHFPGYGSNVDTHTGIAIDKRTAADFEQKDFIPFKAGIEAGVPMVMINHNIVTAYNENMPASLAPEIHNVLRELGFEGIIVTDDLGMGAILEYTGDPYCDAFLAGNDLLCTSDGVGCFNSLYEAAKRGDITEERLNESVYRILDTKLRYGIIETEG